MDCPSALTPDYSLLIPTTFIKDSPNCPLSLSCHSYLGLAFSELGSCEFRQGRGGRRSLSRKRHLCPRDGWVHTWTNEWMNAFIPSLSGTSDWMSPLSTTTMQPLRSLRGCLQLPPGPCLQLAKRTLHLWQVGCRVEKLECFHLFTFTTCHRN